MNGDGTCVLSGGGADKTRRSEVQNSVRLKIYTYVYICIGRICGASRGVEERTGRKDEGATVVYIRPGAGSVLWINLVEREI